MATIVSPDIEWIKTRAQQLQESCAVEMERSFLWSSPLDRQTLRTPFGDLKINPLHRLEQDCCDLTTIALKAETGPPTLSMSASGLIHECCAADESHQQKCTRYEPRQFGRGCRFRRFDEFCTWIDTSDASIYRA